MAPKSFNQKLAQVCDTHGHVCVGLDPSPKEIDEVSSGMSWHPGIADYCRFVVEATEGSAAAYKINSAFFEQHGPEGMIELQATIDFCREVAPTSILILDAKRGDIGNSSTAYASAAFKHYRVDAMTISPYMGWDSVAPFLGNREKGAFVLCRTSNPGSAVFQELEVDGEAVYLRVATEVGERWNKDDNCGLVVGATYPGDLADVARVAPEVPLLIPGVGAQGGSLEATVSALNNSRTFLINSSRGIMYPTREATTRTDLSSAIADASGRLSDEISKLKLGSA